ncbi:MAG: phosphatidylinositol dimannoside acyltransferase, partial [Actinomycetota bacterium]|nr:phosphatidylinositol dimannoside acyltransferase [Actinomycetota bacterium]
AAWRRRGTGVRQLELNLRRVVGPTMPDADLRQLSREAMRSYARYWLEFFRLPVLGRERILGRTQLDGLDHVADLVASGRGVVLALPHSGNWDEAGAWLVLKGFPFTTVAERLEPASVFDRFVAVREQIGMEVLPLTGSERNTLTVLMQRLRAGKVLCLVADREIGDNGIDVSFFGESARMPAGPATLALATGAALMPATLWYSDDGPGGEWRGRIHPEIEPPAGGDRRAKAAAMTQHLADVFAAGVAAHPRDWHMLQPLWTADRPAVARGGSE